MPPYNWAKLATVIVASLPIFHLEGTSVAEQSKSDASQTWWKNGYVWMVLGGPLVVVIASIATFFIAVRNPDTVLDVTVKPAEIGAKAAAAPAEDAMVPAMVGRNHATTGGVPEKQ